MARWLAWVLVMGGALAACVDAGDPWYVERPLVVLPDGPISFDEHIQPIFQRHDCSTCHSAVAPEGALAVHSVDALHTGGDSGPAVKACDSAGSLLIGYLTSCIMPPEGDCLNDVELEILRRWVDEGAAAVFDPNACPVVP